MNTYLVMNFESHKAESSNIYVRTNSCVFPVSDRSNVESCIDLSEAKFDLYKTFVVLLCQLQFIPTQELMDATWKFFTLEYNSDY